MPEEYKHLEFFRENIVNPRRTKGPPRTVEREDRRSHGQKLNAYFGTARKAAYAQIKSGRDGYVLKLRYEGHLPIESLSHHGVEFLSQEGKEVCVVFSSEQGLAQFSEHLQRLGVDDQGLTYKGVLDALVGIESWSSDDRESWALKKKGVPAEERFVVDVELWPVNVSGHPERKRLIEAFDLWAKSARIEVIDKVNMDSLLMYRLRVDRGQIADILNHSDIRLVDLPPSSGVTYDQLNVDIDNIPQEIPSPPRDSAKVCILDSGINSNHPLLRSAIAERAGFTSDKSESDEHGHGTAVAGIALYGDVEACVRARYWRPEAWLFSAKILDENAEYDELTVESVVKEAVTHFVDLGCRIFNLSIGNENSPYDGTHIRGLAYLLDCLAREHDVLFVVSSGNFRGSDVPPVPLASWKDEYPEYLVSEASTVIDPAPALNVLTVGSLARHDATFNARRYSQEISDLAPAREGQPSPFTRHGPTIRGALKPDLVAVGGGLACSAKRFCSAGVLTMHHDFFGNTMLRELSGTSFSAPYVTHLAARLLNEYPGASANLLRAMLVNHASLSREAESTFSEEMREAYKVDATKRNREIARDVVGYGEVDESTLFRSNENEVVILAEDLISNDEHQFYELPLTDDFVRRGISAREIKVTLAHCPAVRTTRIDYIATNMSFRLVKGASIDEIEEHFDRDKKKDHDSMKEAASANRLISSQLREKGTVQSSIWRLRRLDPGERWYLVVKRCCLGAAFYARARKVFSCRITL